MTGLLIVSYSMGCLGFCVRKLTSVLRGVLANRIFFSRPIPIVQSPIYFDREDVKRAIHAPADQTWTKCSEGVFPNGDASLPSAFTVLPDVIEKSNRSVIIHGLGDYILIAEGTRVILQK